MFIGKIINKRISMIPITRETMDKIEPFDVLLLTIPTIPKIIGYLP
jgi:hypothetical protein